MYHKLEGDEAIYVVASYDVVSGENIAHNLEHPPLTKYLYGVTQVLGEQNVFYTRLVALGLGIVSLGLLYYLARKFVSAWSAVITVAIVAFASSWFVRYATFATLEMPLLTAMLLTAVAYFQAKQRVWDGRWLVILGVGAVAAVMIKYYAILLFVVVAVALLIERIGARKWWTFVASFVVTVAVLWIPFFAPHPEAVEAHRVERADPKAMETPKFVQSFHAWVTPYVANKPMVLYAADYALIHWTHSSENQVRGSTNEQAPWWVYEQELWEEMGVLAIVLAIGWGFGIVTVPSGPRSTYRMLSAAIVVFWLMLSFAVGIRYIRYFFPFVVLLTCLGVSGWWYAWKAVERRRFWNGAFALVALLAIVLVAWIRPAPLRSLTTFANDLTTTQVSIWYTLAHEIRNDATKTGAGNVIVWSRPVQHLSYFLREKEQATIQWQTYDRGGFDLEKFVKNHSARKTGDPVEYLVIQKQDLDIEEQFDAVMERMEEDVVFQSGQYVLLRFDDK